MNLLVDEGVDRPIVVRLRQDGYNVLYVTEMSPGITDNVVFQRANEQQSLLLTADKDFGELIYRQGLVHTGIVLLRLAGLPMETKVTLISMAFDAHASEFVGAFSVIAPSIVRIRHQQ
ncbi:hypothetical protein AUJ95_05635 [Candidatus Desantisbacteria bacterium CG2_30_40_21]|uniref:DUF5615 domain-containing protein n=5 Tax=unclassified Candidatus Desantisiibacteriota TaxID=3106372 RepID=A0A2M7JB58_9BACT|nr:MAG: hypothetical protein AUJ95_05635 [Candidatus Desantisbacteria bacterium CG2_30_40_21]PIP42258.1 MAG: hypothetical protein COX18_00890 [Candidatus Desantisbacteria bacterium CG23_combo_of_CG06-09_8_20_14_all_40_23]PIX16639.1 MAG: hypothetical protein COZ71_07180 [Candidatus Desantisbacteria bacterium CG_4_8_14_3_um_filter_40_12]PIY20046.1 MAG: hypothetical protein COZ13_02105 [Candidatus Desantisbacteria bacterium CG_4_10_14_3_um_filter_40_18]PJB28678.1 MAG: hypothetical protein CO110_08